MLEAERELLRIVLSGVVAGRRVLLEHRRPVQPARDEEDLDAVAVGVQYIREAQLVALPEPHVLVEPRAQQAEARLRVQVEEQQRTLDEGRVRPFIKESSWRYQGVTRLSSGRYQGVIKEERPSVRAMRDLHSGPAVAKMLSAKC